MSTQQKKQQRNGNELEVVRWKDIEPHLRAWEKRYNARHTNIKGNRFDNQHTRTDEVRQITAREQFAMAAGCSVDRINTLFGTEESAKKKGKQTSEFVMFSMADALMTVADCYDLLANGTIEVHPNPRYSPEKWAERMRERGCFDG